MQQPKTKQVASPIVSFVGTDHSRLPQAALMVQDLLGVVEDLGLLPLTGSVIAMDWAETEHLDSLEQTI